MNMKKGVIDRKQEYHMPMQLKRKAHAVLFFFKPKALCIKIESPWSQNVTTYDMKYQL